MKNRIHYVSGYWPLPKNLKNDLAHYFKLLPRTLSRLSGQNLKFFSSDQYVLDLVVQQSSIYGINCETSLLPFDSLPRRALAEALVESCARMKLDQWSKPSKFFSEKGVTHYWRDLQESGVVVYTNLLSIWLSKVALVVQTASENNHNIPLAWIDCSLQRISNKRTNWRYWSQSVSPSCVSHYASPMKYYGRLLPVSAGYLSAYLPVWNELNSLFDEVAWQASRMSYGHDEETILFECFSRRPELFNCIGKPYSCLSLLSSFRERSYDFLRGLSDPLS